MQETTIAKLRKNTKHYFDTVERGEIVHVYRRGQPIAEIVPIPGAEPSWKRETPRLTIPGLSFSREILKDRSEADS